MWINGSLAPLTHTQFFLDRFHGSKFCNEIRGKKSLIECLISGQLINTVAVSFIEYSFIILDITLIPHTNMKSV